MAITNPSTGTYAGGAFTTSQSFDVPAVTNGQFMLLTVGTAIYAANTPSGGWTPVGVTAQLDYGSGNRTYVQAFYKFVTADAAATTITISVPSSDHCIAGNCSIWNNVGSLETSTNSTTYDGSGGFSIGAMTTTLDNAVQIILQNSVSGGSGIYMPVPTDFTLIGGAAGGATRSVGSYWRTIAVAGSSGGNTLGTNGVSCRSAAITFAMKGVVPTIVPTAFSITWF